MSSHVNQVKAIMSLWEMQILGLETEPPVMFADGLARAMFAATLVNALDAAFDRGRKYEQCKRKRRAARKYQERACNE